jgi:acetylornithine/succinyldiaminopimelate/putrescine aminotransferase
MALRKRPRRFLCVELPTERDAIEVAKRIARKLADRSQARGGVVIITDEHGKEVGQVSVPSKQKH